jgi:hypothetical protein
MFWDEEVTRGQQVKGVRWPWNELSELLNHIGAN